MLRTGAIGVVGTFVVNGGNLEIFRDMWDESTVTGCGSRYLSLGHALFIYLFNFLLNSLSKSFTIKKNYRHYMSSSAKPPV